MRCERYGGRCLLTGGVRRRARRKRWSSGGTSWPRYGGAVESGRAFPCWWVLPAAGGWWVVWWFTPG